MNPIIGQIVLFGGGRCPTGWHLCDGSQLPMMQYTKLYSVLGTKFGGDGRMNFGLPKLTDLGGALYIIATDGEFPIYE